MLSTLLVEIKLWIGAFVGWCSDERAANEMQEVEMQSSTWEAAAQDLQSVNNLAAKL